MTRSQEDAQRTPGLAEKAREPFVVDSLNEVPVDFVSV